MAKTELGSKHKCQNCGTKFFDLNKEPVVCPKCGEVQQTLTAAPTAPVARSTPRPPAARDEEDNDTEDGPEVMSLEDADQAEDGQVAAAGTDDDADTESDDDSNDDSNDDDTFLEEEDDDDSNVSDLIDGDIENDEER